MYHRCRICCETKRIDEMAVDGRYISGVSDICIVCKKERLRCQRRQEKKKYNRTEGGKKAMRRREAKRRKSRAEEFLRWKMTLSCNRCGFSHPAALVFHHEDPTKKEGDMGTMPYNSSWTKINREAEKCEVLCQNCHKIEHHAHRYDGLEPLFLDIKTRTP